MYLVNAASTDISESERIEFILAGGALIWLLRTPPKQLWNRNHLNSLGGLPLLPLLAAAPEATAGLPSKIFWFFATAGAFVFGSGLAIIPFLYGGVVKTFQWLDTQQFLDAVR